MDKFHDRERVDLEETSSTNDVALDLLNQAAKQYVVTAKRQVSGRGRRGRSWVSEEGNLFLSLTFEAELKDLGQLVILSGLSVLQTIEHFCPAVNAQVKWPNDVMIDGAKISGILFERGIDNWWIMGVGINLVSSPQLQMMYPTVSLKSLGVDVCREDVLAVFISKFSNIYDRWRNGEFKYLKKTWLDKAYKRGKNIVIKQNDSEVSGIFQTIDDDGSLILQMNGCVRKIIVGDVY